MTYIISEGTDNGVEAELKGNIPRTILFDLDKINVVNNQISRSKQRGIKLTTLQSSRVFDPRGSRQMSASSRLARCSRE